MTTDRIIMRNDVLRSSYIYTFRGLSFFEHENKLLMDSRNGDIFLDGGFSNREIFSDARHIDGNATLYANRIHIREVVDWCSVIKNIERIFKDNYDDNDMLIKHFSAQKYKTAPHRRTLYAFLDSHLKPFITWMLKNKKIGNGNGNDNDNANDNDNGNDNDNDNDILIQKDIDRFISICFGCNVIASLKYKCIHFF